MNKRPFPFIDLHEDLLLHLNHREVFDGQWQTDIEKINQANARVVVTTAFPHPRSEDYFDPENTLLIERDLEGYKDLEKEHRHLHIVKTVQDLDRCVASTVETGFLLHIEGLNTFKGTPAEWKRLEKWYEIGLRSVGIVWNLTNALGGGTDDPDTELTELGKEVIQWCKDRSLIIDLAHMNEATFWDTAKLLTTPLVVSHGNARTLQPDSRNYSDHQLQAIAASEGIIGVFFSRRFLAGEGRATLDTVVAHINYMRAVVGIDHIAIGSDLGGLIYGLVEGLESIDKINALWEKLYKEGYTYEDIAKIAYGNAYRVLREVLPQTL